MYVDLYVDMYECIFFICIYMKYQNYNQTINIQQNKIIN